jgi:Family of unknown function (DUF5723)
MKKLSILLVFTTFFAQILRGQQEQTLHFATDIWQSNLTNPAFIPKQKIVVALPSFYYNYTSPNATLKDIQDATASLNPLNKVAGNVSLQTLGFSFPLTSAIRLNVHHAAHAFTSGSINRNLASLYDKGNAQFLGQTVDFTSSLTTTLYNEWALGLTYKLQESLSLGLRVKYLAGNGLSDYAINKATIGFDNANYGLTFDNDLKVTTFSRSNLDSVKTALDVVTKQQPFTPNTGFAFDLGGSMKLGKLGFNVSIIDLGASINWQKEGKSFTSKGTYTYAGLRTDNFFKFDSISSKGFQDTLKKVVGLVENTEGAYRQTLPTKIYLSSTYDLTEKVRLGALLYTEFDPNNTRFGFIGNAAYKWNEHLTVGGSLGLRNGAFDNVGLSVVSKFGPVQAYFVSDNVIAAFSPNNSKNSNGRLGINLVF